MFFEDQGLSTQLRPLTFSIVIFITIIPFVGCRLAIWTVINSSGRIQGAPCVYSSAPTRCWLFGLSPDSNRPCRYLANTTALSHHGLYVLDKFQRVKQLFSDLFKKIVDVLFTPSCTIRGSCCPRTIDICRLNVYLTMDGCWTRQVDVAFEKLRAFAKPWAFLCLLGQTPNAILYL